jgi:hypothetical protein
VQNWKALDDMKASPLYEEQNEDNEDQERVLELCDLGDGTAHLRFRGQLPSHLVDKIRTLLKSGRGSNSAMN